MYFYYRISVFFYLMEFPVIGLCVLYDVGRSDALITKRPNVTTCQLSKNRSFGKDDHIKVYGKTSND